MIRNHWRTIIGPLITLALAGLILLSDRYLFRVPNPGAISFLAVAFSAYLGGITLRPRRRRDLVRTGGRPVLRAGSAVPLHARQSRAAAWC